MWLMQRPVTNIDCQVLFSLRGLCDDCHRDGCTDEDIGGTKAAHKGSVSPSVPTYVSYPRRLFFFASESGHIRRQLGRARGTTGIHTALRRLAVPFSCSAIPSPVRSQLLC